MTNQKSTLKEPIYSTVENNRYIWTAYDEEGNKYESRLTSMTLQGAEASFLKFKKNREQGTYSQSERNFGVK